MNSDSESSQSCMEGTSLSRSARATTTDRNRLSSRGTLPKLSKYIPKTRVERLKTKPIPESSGSKLIVASNLEGNGFRWHEKDIDNLLVDQDSRNHIRTCIKESTSRLMEVNRDCFAAWSRKRAAEGGESSHRTTILQLLSGWIMLALLLLNMNIHPTLYIDGVLLASILVCVLAIGGMAFHAYASKYNENNFETQLKRLIRERVKSFNAMPHFSCRGMRWRTTKDCFWLSLKLPSFDGVPAEIAT